MNKDLIIAFLLVLLSHKFLLNLIENRPKIEKMDNTVPEPAPSNMKDELMQFIMNLQGSASGTSGVTEVSSANTMAKASFGSESTDLSKHFAMKASDAIAKLPSSTETHNPVDSAPVPIDTAPTPMSGSDFLLLKRSTDDSVMNGGSFFGNVVPFSNDSAFAGL